MWSAIGVIVTALFAGGLVELLRVRPKNRALDAQTKVTFADKMQEIAEAVTERVAQRLKDTEDRLDKAEILNDELARRERECLREVSQLQGKNALLTEQVVVLTGQVAVLTERVNKGL